MSMTATHADTWLRDAVMQELAWDPAFDATKIAATTKEGVVALSGYVDTYAARLAAERAARRVYGVTAIVNELAVALVETRVDPDLAADALQALATPHRHPARHHRHRSRWLYHARRHRRVDVPARVGGARGEVPPRRSRRVQQHRGEADGLTTGRAEAHRGGASPSS